MEGAEDRTVSRLKAVRAEIWQPTIEASGGRIVNIVADSVLAEFDSAVAAAAAAIDVQQRMAHFNEELGKEQRLQFRIGLHLGEVIVDETQTIFGDAVNVAARIQLMAKPGEIAASRAFRDATHLQIGRAFEYGGKHRAKNIRRSLQIYHLHTRANETGPLARAIHGMRRAGIPICMPAVSKAVGAALVLLGAGGYLALSTNQIMSVRMVALTLSADQLEEALAERRKADALVAEKRQLEEADAKQKTDPELESAQKARQKAEHDLTQLKAEIEARGKAANREADQAIATVQRAAGETARRSVEAEATALRHAEAERAARVAALAIPTHRPKQAELEAAGSADKSKATTPRLEEKAEATEGRRGLQSADRQRLQVALTSLGFDTHGDDGVFGQRSREMIAHWQRARNQPATGFVTKAQQQALLKEAAATPSKYDEQGKSAEDLKGRLTGEVSLAPSDSPAGAGDGLWRGVYECGRNGNFLPFTLKPEIYLKGGAGNWYTVGRSWTNNTIGISVSIEGPRVRVTRLAVASGGSMAGGTASTAPLSGWFEGNSIQAGNNICTIVLTRNVSYVQPARAPTVRHGLAALPSL